MSAFFFVFNNTCLTEHLNKLWGKKIVLLKAQLDPQKLKFHFWDPQQIQGKPGLTFLVRSGKEKTGKAHYFFQKQLGGKAPSQTNKSSKPEAVWV